MMDVKVIGVDIAQQYFQVHGISASGMVSDPAQDLAGRHP